MHRTRIETDPLSVARELFGLEPRHRLRVRAAAPDRVFSPRFDVRETDDSYVVEADVPGVAREAVEVELHEGVLRVRGERQQTVTESAETYHVYERRHGRFERAFRLPEDADADQVEARLNDGVLRVTVGKRAAPQPRKIEIGDGPKDQEVE